MPSIGILRFSEKGSYISNIIIVMEEFLLSIATGIHLNKDNNNNDYDIV